MNGVNLLEMPYIIEHGVVERGITPHSGQEKGVAGMGRIIKALLFLAVLGFIGLTGYAYLGDLAPQPTDITQPVTLNVD